MKEIPLTRGYVALVDDDDFERVSKFNWYASHHKHTVYAVRRPYVGNYKSSNVYLHRELLNAPKGMDVDHIDRNGLNCTRSNLRLATRAQNMANGGPRQGNKAFGVRGIHLDRRRNVWVGMIRRTGEPTIYIGSFKTVQEAAIAYNEKAREIYGEFARLNPVPEVSQ